MATTHSQKSSFHHSQEHIMYSWYSFRSSSAPKMKITKIIIIINNIILSPAHKLPHPHDYYAMHFILSVSIM